MPTEIAWGCASATLAGLAVFWPIASRRRRTCGTQSHAIWGVLILQVRASVLGCYLISMTLQAVVYPTVVAIAWFSWPSERGSWLGSRGGLFADPSLLGLRIELYAFFGYLVNDLPMSWENPLIRLHHIVCILGLLVAFYTPEAHVATALGIFALEYGSLFYNAWLIDETMRDVKIVRLWPRSRTAVGVAYMFGMTLSNFVAGSLLVQVVWSNAIRAHWGFSCFYAACGGPLLFLRQKEVFCAEKPPSAARAAKAS